MIGSDERVRFELADLWKGAGAHIRGHTLSLWSGFPVRFEDQRSSLNTPAPRLASSKKNIPSPSRTMELPSQRSI